MHLRQRFFLTAFSLSFVGLVTCAQLKSSATSFKP